MAGTAFFQVPMTRDPSDAVDPLEDRRSRHAIDLDNYIPALLTHLALKLSGGAAAIYRRQFGLSITDWRIMALLAGEPWMTAGRVSALYGYDKAAVSRGLGSMLAKGLIETRFQGNNRRRQHLALTPDGLKMHDEIVKIALAREAQLVAGLTDDERRALVALLTRMATEIPKLSGD
jgi:DNA-binding MarR family transcriptional regulator